MRGFSLAPNKQADPSGVYEHIDSIYVAATNTSNADAMLAMVCVMFCFAQIFLMPAKGKSGVTKRRTELCVAPSDLSLTRSPPPARAPRRSA